MDKQTEVRKLLVLRGPNLESGEALSAFEQQFRIEVVDNLDDALEAMRDGQFTAVLAETGDFLPLERGMGMQQSSVVLDTIGDGVCIIGAGGELVWANRRQREFPETHIDSLRRVCKKVYEEFAADSHRRSDEPLRAKRFSLMPEGGTYYEVICSPVLDRQGLLRQVAAVVVNATNQRRQQLKLNAIERAGRELVRLDYDLLRNRDARQRLGILEERIIRCSRDVLSYEHFAVLLLNERTNRLEIVTSVGLDDGEDYELFASTQGNGICGYVAATGTGYICPDTRKDPRYIRGLSGARSSLTVPLRLHDKVVGVLNAESRRPAAFSEEDRQFAEMFANHVALALHILNLLVHERHSTHSQISDSICADLTGPLNDLVTAATEIQEDYIGHDDLRRRIGEVIDAAIEARKTVEALSRAEETGVVDAPKPVVSPDPLLTGKRILVADDEELIRQTVHDVLQPYGCAVETAADGSEAVEKLSAQRYDLVISDIKMPGANGYEVFAAAKEADASTAVILITGFGYDPSHSIVRARQEGLAAVLMKPFKVRQLLDECRAAFSEGD